MEMESKVFRRRRPVPAELEKYGFTKTPEGWVYETDLLAGAFRAQITVCPQQGMAETAQNTAGSSAPAGDGSVQGDVIDAETGEPYAPLRVERGVGKFAAEVRLAYLDLLEDIAGKCFQQQRFLWAQTERIAAAIADRYGDAPESIFEKYPEITTFRIPRTHKWYGITMEVQAGSLRAKSAGGVKQPAGGTGKQTDTQPQKSSTAGRADPLDRYTDKQTVEIMNVKLPADQVEAQQKVPGIYQAYHMNKKYWVTILLDGAVPDKDILALVETSHAIVARGGGKTGGTPLEEHTWVIPYAYDFFNVAAAFEESPDLEWQQAARMEKGDTVYMYCGAPIKAIRYRCTVRETDIPNHTGYREDRYPYLVLLHLEESYADDVMPLAKMRELGLTGVRGARRVPEKLAGYMRSL